MGVTLAPFTRAKEFLFKITDGHGSLLPRCYSSRAPSRMTTSRALSPSLGVVDAVRGGRLEEIWKSVDVGPSNGLQRMPPFVRLRGLST